MNKIVLIFFFFFSLYAKDVDFPCKFSLKKDEYFNLLIKYNNKIRELKLRWTLYKNRVLTVLYWYDDFPHHIMVFKDYPLNYFKIDLLHYPERNPYLLVQFLKFNDKIATFKIYIFNKEELEVKSKGKVQCIK